MWTLTALFYSVIRPAETHPDVILYAVSSRNYAAAREYAQKYKFTKAYGSYQEVLDDEAVDIVYVSTPNGMHFEWAAKAMEKGKHVLCEKPFTANGEEARKLVEIAARKGVILEEAVCFALGHDDATNSDELLQFHWQFHPAAHKWHQILDSKKYGKILHTNAIMTSGSPTPAGDVRYQFHLGGGSAMDLTYALNFTRQALHARHPVEIQSVTTRPACQDPRIDEAMFSVLTFRGPEDQLVSSRIYTDMSRAYVAGAIPRFWELPSIEVEADGAIVYFYNALMPHLYHYISITEKRTGHTSYVKQYSGGPLWGNVTTSTGEKGGNSSWSTFRWQLEAFVEAVRGRTPAYWIPSEESVAQMEVIDSCYRAARLPVRQGSSELNGKKEE